jgi:hypothetical protein
LIRLGCAELAKQLLNKIGAAKKKRKWVPEWIGRGKKLGASAMLLKDLSTKNITTNAEEELHFQQEHLL